MIASGNTFNADLTLTPPLAVGSFITSDTPGNVAVCLSGGGSRAMTSGMGQLLALETLVAGNASLLSQTKMISTVSGGSWIGVPFTFLTPGTTDSAFLGGPYTEPASLTVDLDARRELRRLGDHQRLHTSRSGGSSYHPLQTGYSRRHAVAGPHRQHIPAAVRSFSSRGRLAIVLLRV